MSICRGCKATRNRSRNRKWTAQAKEALTKFKGKSRQYLNAREEVRRTRREYQKLKRRWEKDYWEERIQEARDAQDRNDIGAMYKVLRKLGMRDSKAARAAEHFSPEEYKQHFEKVSQEKYERTPEEIQQLKIKSLYHH